MSAVANHKISTATSYRGKSRKCGITAVLQYSASFEESAG